MTPKMATPKHSSPAVKWVSFKHQSPKKRGDYLVWQPAFEGGMGTCPARYAILNWTGTKFRTALPVSHWQVLDAPPKEEA